MENITLKKYQQKAVDNTYEKADEFLKNFNGGIFKKILFRAPTGSGKTVMMSSIIERLVLESEENLSFVWISKGVLAEQSKDSIEEKIGGGSITTSFLEDILDNCIKKNEVLFINWEEIFSKAGKDNLDKGIKKGDPINRFMRDNEDNRFLSKFCEKTIEEGRKIILIIDESHLNITSNTIQIIEEIIKPSLQIDMTATPKNRSGYSYGDRDGEYIKLQDVKEEQMIKKEVIINPEIDSNDLKSGKGGDQIILEKALQKREELEELYKKEGSKIRPLVLIQLPNEEKKLSELDKQKRDCVESFLSKKGFSYKNKNLARWLSGSDKENLEDVKNLDSDVDFLIFKQAIATGWDCPRSYILVKFRQSKSEIFEVQTVGRIMRMPELKHYEEEKLNRAYVYANLEEITIEENALEYLKTKKAKRKEDYKDTNLKSVYLMRGEYNDLMLDYRKYFFNKFIEEIGGKLDEHEARNNSNLLRKYKSADGTYFIFDAKSIEEKIIINKFIKNIDKGSQNIKAEDQNRVKMNTEETGRNFIAFLKKNCGEFQPARSFEKIRVSIYQLFDKYLGIKNTDKLYIQKVVLSNSGFFQDIIQGSIKEYAKYRNRAEKQYKEISNWNVPNEDYYSKNAVEKNYKNCVMKPSYVSQKWKTEVGFIENYLEEVLSINWWFKNGDAKNEIYLGIPYTDERGKLATFYPDFIVYYKDNRIGIFDPKEGQTAKSDDTKLKAEALQRYIKENKEKKLFGGIVKPDKDKKIWTINYDEEYSYENGNWKPLNLN